jgi:hypothetical protein
MQEALGKQEIRENKLVPNLKKGTSEERGANMTIILV